MITKNETSLPYSLEAVAAEIEKFSVESNDGTVTTMPPNGGIRTAKVTSQYKLLDIKEFFMYIIDSLAKTMDGNIEYYTLRLDKGIQEIALMSSIIVINGDEYRKSFYILNSTDRTRALRFNIGLYRADGQRLIIPVPNTQTILRFVHKGKEFENKIKAVINFVETFGQVAEQQVAILKELGTQKVSVRQLFRKMLFPPESSTDIIANASSNRAIAFSKQLRVHPTDKINIVDYGISMSDMAELSKPADFLIKTNKDFYINAYQALQCYHAIYQNRDVGIISHESARFMSYITLCGTVPDTHTLLNTNVVHKQKAVVHKQTSIEV